LSEVYFAPLNSLVNVGAIFPDVRTSVAGVTIWALASKFEIALNDRWRRKQEPLFKAACLP
jgi:hypothetical protein